ncbi:putative acyl-CoA-binding protein [Lamellibrachia satsuma]|nr:putative acyl-CoA-binding protein [Lamellibrachia satsuma]
MSYPRRLDTCPVCWQRSVDANDDDRLPRPTADMADSEDFKKAAADVRNLDKTPANEDYSKMYGLYKQATVGDCDRDRPSSADALAKGKYEAWVAFKGLSQADAAAQYIVAAKENIAKYGLK